MSFSGGLFSGGVLNGTEQARVYSPRRGSIPWLESLTEWRSGSYFWVSGFDPATGDCWDYKVHWDQLPYAKPQEVVDYLAFNAYGGMRYTAAESLSDLGASWQRLTGLDEQLPTVPRYITIDLVNGKFSFTYPGIYSVAITGFLSHDALTAKQTTGLRIYDATDGASFVSRVLISSNGSVGTKIGNVFLIEISSDEVGNEFSIELGGGDSYSTVVLDTFEMTIVSASEFMGELPE